MNLFVTIVIISMVLVSSLLYAFHQTSSTIIPDTNEIPGIGKRSPEQIIQFCTPKTSQSISLNRCLHQLAAATNESKYCFLMQEQSDELDSKDCLNVVARNTGDVQLCKFLDRKEMETCIRDIAFSNRDPQFCEEFEDITQQDNCKILISGQILTDRIYVLRQSSKICSADEECILRDVGRDCPLIVNKDADVTELVNKMNELTKIWHPQEEFRPLPCLGPDLKCVQNTCADAKTGLSYD